MTAETSDRIAKLLQELEKGGDLETVVWKLLKLLSEPLPQPTNKS